MATAATNSDKDKLSPSLTFESLSKPPSSVSEDGQFIYRPPANSSFFFGRSIAKYNLVKADGESKAINEPNENEAKDKESKEQGQDQDQDQTTNKKENEQEQTATTPELDLDLDLHPIQIASARIHTHGIAELYKVINLSRLIQDNEFFGLTTVVDSTARSKMDSVSVSAAVSAAVAADSKKAKAKGKGSGTDATSKDGIKEDHHHHHPSSDMNIDIGGDDDNDEYKKERQLRSQYVLNRKRSQYESSSSTFAQHYKKLKVVSTMQHTIDERLLQLRKRWRLFAPTHGVHVSYPIQPRDVIAIDVDIYSDLNNRGNSSSSSGSGNDGNDNANDAYFNALKNSLHHSSMLGRIARMVPRFATIELSNEYDIKQQLQKQNERERQLKLQLLLKDKGKDKSKDDDKDDDKDEDMGENDNNNENKGEKDKQEEEEEEFDEEKSAEIGKSTIAQPFLITESSASNEVQKDDVENVPMLTLLLQIEKSSTGFVQSVSLSSNIASSPSTSKSKSSASDEGGTNEQKEKQNQGQKKENQKDDQNVTKAIIDKKTKLHSDELLIQSLQHSLFCANVFDSIRQEIIHDQRQEQHKSNTTTSTSTSTAAQQNELRKKKITKNTASAQHPDSQQQQQQQHIAWLSSEMEDSFLPPPSLMAGRNQRLKNVNDVDIINNDIPNSPLSVICCHEGEVKVQLDSEYSLTIKLVDVNNMNNMNNSNTKNGTCTDGATGANTNATSAGTSSGAGSGSGSGSQSPEQLHILCRLLLLQAQMVYHNNRKEQLQKLDDAIQAQKDDMAASKVIDYSAGMSNRRGGGGLTTMSSAAAQSQAIMKQNQKLLSMMKPPCILQSCVGLGTKVILERKVRKALKVCFVYFHFAGFLLGRKKRFYLLVSINTLTSFFGLTTASYDMAQEEKYHQRKSFQS